MTNHQKNQNGIMKMLNKKQILERETVRRKNYDYVTRTNGYVGVDEYYVALRDVGFITEEEYSKVRWYNETFYIERKHEDNDE